MSDAFFQKSPPPLPAINPASKSFWVLLSLASITVFALLAMYFGVDASWDLKIYHLYNRYAQLTDRIGIDHNAAHIQSYLNPTLDLLLTWPLFTSGGPLLMSVVLGGLQGLNFALVTAACLYILQAINVTPIKDRLIFAVLAAFLGMTGAIVLSEIGTTHADLTTALLILCAFICCMRCLSITDDRFDMKLIVAAGLFSGLAAGLKLTNGVFVVSFFGIIALFGGARRLRGCLLYGTASFVAIVIVQGWWSWKLLQWFGSPIFPFFNDVFHSPYFPEERDAGSLAKLFPMEPKTSAGLSVLLLVEFPDQRCTLPRFSLPGGIPASDSARREAAVLTTILHRPQREPRAQDCHAVCNVCRIDVRNLAIHIFDSALRNCP